MNIKRKLKERIRVRDIDLKRFISSFLNCKTETSLFDTYIAASGNGWKANIIGNVMCYSQYKQHPRTCLSKTIKR